MDYQKLRKWLRFYEKENVSAVEAIRLVSFWVTSLRDFPSDCSMQPDACEVCHNDVCPLVDDVK